MKKYTQAEFDALLRDEGGVKICPAGDYTEVKSFGAECCSGRLFSCESSSDASSIVACALHSRAPAATRCPRSPVGLPRGGWSSSSPPDLSAPSFPFRPLCVLANPPTHANRAADVAQPVRQAAGEDDEYGDGSES